MHLAIPSKTVLPGDYSRACAAAPVQPTPPPTIQDVLNRLQRIEMKLNTLLYYEEQRQLYPPLLHHQPPPPHEPTTQHP